MYVDDKQVGEQQTARTTYPAHIQAILEHADWMDGLDAPDFDMRSFNHTCGTPSCAFGYFARRNGCEAYSMALKFLGQTPRDTFSKLFGGGLCGTIRTPQQWAAHARNWCAAQGYPA